MKTRLLALVATACLSFLAGTLVPSLSMQSGSGRYLKIDFMKVEPGRGQDYVNLERTLWKPIHEDLIKSGNLRSWTLFAVQPVAGKDEKYDYATVLAFDKRQDSLNTDALWNQVIAKVHRGKDPSELSSQTLKLRKQVRSEIWLLMDETR